MLINVVYNVVRITSIATKTYLIDNLQQQQQQCRQLRQSRN